MERLAKLEGPLNPAIELAALRAEVQALRARIAVLEGRLADTSLGKANAVRRASAVSSALKVADGVAEFAAAFPMIGANADLLSAHWKGRIAERMNARGIRAPRGGKWTTKQVARALDRLADLWEKETEASLADNRYPKGRRFTVGQIHDLAARLRR